MLSPKLVLSALVPVTAALAGCGSKSEGGAPSPETLTYSADIAPILAEKCVKCHQEGGAGGFRLDRYSDVRPMAPAMVAMTKEGRMPPYLVAHDGSCGSFEDSETLTAEQIAKIEAWNAAGRPEGKPVTAPAVVGRPGLAQGVDYKTPVIAPVIEGGLRAEFDEYRCFPLTGGIDKDAFITGYDVFPGNPAIVHHVVGFLVDPERMTRAGKTNGELMKEYDERDERAGWTCFGGAGEKLEADAVPVVWAPGQGPVYFPEKMGVPHKKSHTLVVQLHYNLSDPKRMGETDTTTVRFRHADAVERKLAFLLHDPFLNTLFTPTPQSLPPGSKATKVEWKQTGMQLGLGAVPYVDLMAVMPHMHERGVRKEMRLIDAAGNDTCAARVDRWDFNWQKFYFYKGTPPRITPQSSLQMTCEYDTSLDTAPVLPGWGTRNEMCIAILMVALPPGA